MMAETHDMEMTCVGSTHGGDFPNCTFGCRFTANSHEEGLRRAAEMHEQQRKEQQAAHEADPWNNPSPTICSKPMFWVYPEPCWDCMWEESMPKEYKEQMAQAMAFFTNFALNGMSSTVH